MRGMAPGPAGEQPVLGEVLDEIRPGDNLPLRQRAQDIGPYEALGRFQDGEAPGAVMLRIVPLVIAWTIPAPLEGMVGAALGHALGHELVRRRARRKAEANRWCLHRRVSIGSRQRSDHAAGQGLFAFAVPIACQAVRVPGAALIRAPLPLAAVDRTPARVGVVGGL